jgi:hypothetical protein
VADPVFELELLEDTDGDRDDVFELLDEAVEETVFNIDRVSIPVALTVLDVEPLDDTETEPDPEADAELDADLEADVDSLDDGDDDTLADSIGVNDASVTCGDPVELYVFDGVKVYRALDVDDFRDVFVVLRDLLTDGDAVGDLEALDDVEIVTELVGERLTGALRL